MSLKLIPPGQGSKLREYYIRFEGSMYGALRVRLHPERVPFTVGDVFVNRSGADFVLCVCAQASEEDKNANKPVVTFKIDRDILDRKELSFNVI